MGKKLQILKRRLFNILFWSVVSAAFIGPGTVTTVTKAGAYYHYDLMWSVIFSIFAALLLQEASARITIYSGMNLGQAISRYFEGKKSRLLVLILVVGAIILGSAAYETGNIIGAVEGLHFVFQKVPKSYFVIGIGLFAFLSFSLRSVRLIAQFMGAFVILMGIAFFTTAFFVKPDVSAMLKGIFIPTIPNVAGAGLLILGIIGTTVVPYDIFLGSGIIDKSQTIKDARFGLSVAIILGGVITMAIMTVGSAITEGWSQKAINNMEFSFDLIKNILYLNSFIGDLAVYIFGFGMFAAGFTSAITAPLASAITARSVFGFYDKRWAPKSLYYYLITVGILLTGMTFGLLQVKPIPAIIAAQAFNGLILPFISIFLIIVINDPDVMKEKVNNWFLNILMIFVVWLTTVIGLLNLTKAMARTLKFDLPDPDRVFLILSIISGIISLYVFLHIIKIRKRGKDLTQKKIDQGESD